MHVLDDMDLKHWFTYHAPTKDDIPAYEEIREAGLALARAILKNTPSGADQTAAIRKVRETVMAANLARACAGAPLRDSAAAGD